MFQPRAEGVTLNWSGSCGLQVVDPGDLRSIWIERREIAGGMKGGGRNEDAMRVGS